MGAKNQRSLKQDKKPQASTTYIGNGVELQMNQTIFRSFYRYLVIKGGEADREGLERGEWPTQIHGECVFTNTAELENHFFGCKSSDSEGWLLCNSGHVRSDSVINWKFLTEGMVTRPWKLSTKAFTSNARQTMVKQRGTSLLPPPSFHFGLLFCITKISEDGMSFAYKKYAEPCSATQQSTHTLYRAIMDSSGLIGRNTVFEPS